VKNQFKNSPLTYVLAQIKISPVLQIENYVPEVQEAIRKEFPILKKISVQTIEIKQNSENTSVRIVNQWHFANKQSTTGILIDSESIMIHISEYKSFRNLIDQFCAVLEKLSPILEIDLYLRTGLRYINFVKSFVSEFIIPELRGFYLENQNGFKKNYIAKTELLQETEQGLIKVQTSHISSKNTANKEVLNNIFVPLDLQQGASLLSFDLHKDKNPEKDYFLLDIDHFSMKNSDFSIKNIKSNLNELHTGINRVFQTSFTEQAFCEWR